MKVGRAVLVAVVLLAAALVEVTNFGANPSNLRMHIYVPDRVLPRPPILVAVHYCTGSGPVFFSGTAGVSTCIRHKRCGGAAGSDPVGIKSMVDWAVANRNGDRDRVVPATCFATTPPNEWNSGCANGTIVKTARQWGDAARSMFPGYTGPRSRMQLWHGTADSTLRFPSFGEEVKQWTNVLAVSQTPSVTDSPRPGWTRTRYGGTGVRAPVEAISLQGVGHSLPLAGQAAMAIAFFGLG